MTRLSQNIVIVVLIVAVVVEGVFFVQINTLLHESLLREKEWAKQMDQTVAAVRSCGEAFDALHTTKEIH